MGKLAFLESWKMGSLTKVAKELSFDGKEIQLMISIEKTDEILSKIF